MGLKKGEPASRLAPPTSVAGATVARRAPHLLGESFGGAQDQRFGEIVGAAEPVGNRIPLLAVPLDQPKFSAAGMIGTAQFSGSKQSIEAKFLEPRFTEVAVLKSPAGLVAADWTVSKCALGCAHAFRQDHCKQQALIVEYSSAILNLACALAGPEDELLKIFVDTEIIPGHAECGADITLGGVPGGNDIRLRGAPPIADQAFNRKFNAGSLFDSCGRHDAPAPDQNVVGLVTPYLQPGRALFHHCGRRDRVPFPLEAISFGHLVQHREWLFAVSRVEIYQSDFLTFKLVKPADFAGNVGHDGCGLLPIISDNRKFVGKQISNSALQASVAWRDDRHLVGESPIVERVADTRAERQYTRQPHRIEVLVALVALDAALVVVLCFTLLNKQLGSVKTAVSFVEKSDVVNNRIGLSDPIGREWTNPIGRQQNSLAQIFRCSDGASCHGNRAQQRDRQSAFADDVHFEVPFTSIPRCVATNWTNGRFVPGT